MTQLGALLGLLLVGALVTRRRRPVIRRNPRPRRRPIENPWVTMRGHRLFIDDEGRIQYGKVPRRWRGVHVRDVSALSRRWREIDREEDDCGRGGARARATFRNQAEGLRELLDANPHLVAFLEGETKGQAERAYQAWVRGGRRGRKPTTKAAGDGRFDTINEQLERRGRRAVGSWSEAVRAIVPPSKRWADFGARLELLEEATGLRLHLPAPAEALELGGQRGAECEQLGEGARERLLEEARGGRLTETEQAGVPF